MSESYLGEIRLFPFAFAPRGWALCQGQLLPLNTNQALFALLGTNYGGNGTTNFALPDLRGRAPVSVGQQPGGDDYILGFGAGSETVQITAATMPLHTHGVVATATNANTSTGNGTYFAKPILSAANPTAENLYAAPGTLAPLNTAAISPEGGNAPHENMQPFLVLNYCICVTNGSYPPRN